MSSHTTLLSASANFVHHTSAFRLAVIGVYKSKLKALNLNDLLPELTSAEIDSIILECTKCKVNDVLIPLIIRYIIEEARRELIAARTIIQATP
jgi:hypothetical protein